MLKHLQAGYDIVFPWFFVCKSLGCDLPIINFRTALNRMEFSYLQWRLSHVDSGDPRAALRQCFTENPATTAYVQNIPLADR